MDTKQELKIKEKEPRFVQGSLFLDPTGRNGDLNRPTIAEKKSDPTPIPPICSMFNQFNIKVANQKQ